MINLKVLMLILVALNTFSYNILSKEEEQFALKYYTQEEIDRLDEWVFHLDTASKPEIILKNFKMPNLKFYDNEKLTGKPFAFIDDNGFNYQGKIVCIRKLLDGLDGEFVIDPKNIRFEDLYKEIGDKIVPVQNEIINSGLQCPYFPLERYGSYYDSLQILTRLTVIDGKIGSFKMGDQKVFFDISEWVGKFYVEKNTKTILKEVLTQKDLEEIGDLILGLRKVLENGSVQDIYNYIVKDRPNKDFKNIENIVVFGKLTPELAINRTLTSVERERAIRSTLIANRKINQVPDINSGNNYRRMILTFVKGEGRVNFKLTKKYGSWNIYMIDLFGKDTKPYED